MIKHKSFYTYEDFRKEAKNRIPRFVYDFIDGGAGNETTLCRNKTALGSVRLIPRVGINVQSTSTETCILDRVYSAPFGIAPLGLYGLIHPDGDVIIARSASKFKIPYIASSTSNTSIEKISMAVGEAPWFQLYAPKSKEKLNDLLDRIQQLECPVLVVTVDTAVPGKRLRDIRNGLNFPFKPTISNLVEVVKHPFWGCRRLVAGEIQFPNLAQLNKRSMPFRELMAWQTGGLLDWETLRYLRKYWPRKILLKGVLSVDDAIHAKKIGIDAVIMSNHGGRQLDCVPSPIDVLPEFRAHELSPSFLMLDSGVRSGEDVVKILSMGASFTFVGRPILFWLAANGTAGVNDLLSILFDEVRDTMPLIGAASINENNQLDYIRHEPTISYHC